MSKTLLLELAKKLNIPRQNCMKTKDVLEELSKTPSQSTKRLFLAQIPSSAWCAWKNLQSSKSSIKKCTDKN